MKLLYITNQICGSGGLERVLSIKASYLAEQLGYEVHIITLNQGNKKLFYDFSDKLIYHDIEISGNYASSFLQYLRGLKKKVKTIKPDVISVCDDGLKGFYVPYFLGTKTPIIYERHASKNIIKTSDNASFLQKLKLKLIFSLMHIGARKYDAFVVLTNYNLSEWDLDNLKVIPNPLSFKAQKISSLKNKKVISVGSHHFQKGFDRLLKSWKSVLEKHDDWILEIYGRADTNIYQEMAYELGIENSVRFHPPIKNIQEKYAEASVYAMSSRSEGFGMVLIEAMAHGVPCISFDCPCGPKDIITHEKDGFLIPNGDIEAFSRTLIELIEDQSLRELMGKEAVKKSEHYVPESVVPNWDVLFRSLITK